MQKALETTRGEGVGRKQEAQKPEISKEESPVKYLLHKAKSGEEFDAEEDKMLGLLSAWALTVGMTDEQTSQKAVFLRFIAQFLTNPRNTKEKCKDNQSTNDDASTQLKYCGKIPKFVRARNKDRLTCIRSRNNCYTYAIIVRVCNLCRCWFCRLRIYRYRRRYGRC